MTAIATYVFIDIGAPGLREDNPRPIISLSLLVVRSEDLRRITDENREEMIASPPIQSEEYFHLKYAEFDPEKEILSFLQDLEKPVCLIAFSAFNYDFPILKSVLSRHEATFEDITCADSMCAFYDITMRPDDDKKTSRAARLLGAFPWPSSHFEKPSFALGSIYLRELENTEYYKAYKGRNLDDGRKASGRNMAALRIAVKLSDDFPIWIEKNCYSFAEVPLPQEEVKKEFIF